MSPHSAVGTSPWPLPVASLPSPSKRQYATSPFLSVDTWVDAQAASGCGPVSVVAPPSVSTVGSPPSPLLNEEHAANATMRHASGTSRRVPFILRTYHDGRRARAALRLRRQRRCRTSSGPAP